MLPRIFDERYIFFLITYIEYVSGVFFILKIQNDFLFLNSWIYRNLIWGRELNLLSSLSEINCLWDTSNVLISKQPTRAFTRDKKHPRSIASGSILLINTPGMIGLIDRTSPPVNYIAFSTPRNVTSIHSLIHGVLGRWLAEPVVIAVVLCTF